MSWHFLQEQEEAYWEGSFLAGAPDALLSLMPTVEESFSDDRKKAPLTPSLYGTTSEPLTECPGEAQLTLFPEASRAKTSRQQVRVRDLPETVQAFGLKCSESLAKLGLRLSSRKTVRTFVPVALARLSRDLPAWGMTADGACWELGTSARPTKETDFGYLPTPTTVGNEFSPSMQKWPAHQRLASYSIYTLTGGPHIPFREWLMGMPIGWTALEPLETHRFRQWRQLHLDFYQKGRDE